MSLSKRHPGVWRTDHVAVGGHTVTEFHPNEPAALARETELRDQGRNQVCTWFDVFDYHHHNTGRTT